MKQEKEGNVMEDAEMKDAEIKKSEMKNTSENREDMYQKIAKNGRK